MERTTLTLYVCYDADGDWGSGTDADAAIEAYNDQVGGSWVRVATIALSVPTDPVTVRARGTVEIEAEPATIIRSHTQGEQVDA